MNLFDKGQPVSIVIDDSLPLKRNSWGSMGTDKTLINASPLENGGYWLVLLEKAYAKMNANYANLHGGSPT